MRPVNLLPPDLRGATRRGRRSGSPAPEATGGSGPFVVLGALAMSVVALAGYVLAENTIKDRQAELGAVTREHGVAVRQAAELKPYGTFQELATARVAGVTALADTRFDWDRALTDLSRALPAEVTLSSLSGSLSGSGTTSAGGAAPATTPAVDLAGCTTSHAGVADVMSRLRNVRGVTRVSLASSQKADAEGTQSSDAAGSPCGKTDAPTFALKVLFERFAAGSAVGAAAPSAGTATARASGCRPCVRCRTPRGARHSRT